MLRQHLAFAVLLIAGLANGVVARAIEPESLQRLLDDEASCTLTRDDSGGYYLSRIETYGPNSELKNFSRLKMASLRGGGRLPQLVAQLGEKPELRELHLDGNFAPDLANRVDLSALRKCPRLEVLRLYDNFGDLKQLDLQPLSELKELRALWVYGAVDTSRLIDQIESLPKLEELMIPLSGDDAQDERDLARLAAIPTLKLFHSTGRLGKPELLKPLAPHLERLILSDKHLSEGFVRELRPLQELMLVDCSLSAEAYGELSRLPALETLSLTRCEIQYPNGTVRETVELNNAGAFPSLQRIENRFCSFVDFRHFADSPLEDVRMSPLGMRKLEGLSDIRKLRSLDMMSRFYQDDKALELVEETLKRETLKSMSIVCLYEKPIQLALILSHSSLETASFEYCDLKNPTRMSGRLSHELRKLTFRSTRDKASTVAEMGYISQLAGLKELCLYDMALGDQRLAELNGLNQLEVLDFTDNRDITDKSFSLLRRLDALRELNLQGTAVSAKGLLSLSVETIHAGEAYLDYHDQEPHEVEKFVRWSRP